MLSVLKNLVKKDRYTDKWITALEKETFVFKEGSEQTARTLLTMNHLIDELLGNEVDYDASQTANEWIDSDKVHIRENNEFDCTIDFLLAPNPEKKMEVLSKGDPAFATATQYIIDMVPKPEEMQKKTEELQQRVEHELEALMIRCANQKGGINYAMDVLGAIYEQNLAFLLEMRDELQLKSNINLPKEEQDLHDRCALLADGGNLMNSTQSLLKKISKEAEDIAICKREIIRREYAIKFFSWLQASIQTWAYTIRKTGSLLDYMRQSNNLDLASIIQTKDDEKATPIGPKEITLANFLSNMDENNILTISRKSVDDVKAQIMAFVTKNIND